MAKALAGIIAILLTMGSFGPVQAGDWTAHGFLYKPSPGARGTVEKGRYDSGQDRVDARLNKEIWVGDPNYGTTIQDAMSAIGSANVMLRIPAGTHNITANLTIPTNVHVKPERGALLSVATGTTLTINGSLRTGLYQIFSLAGTGKVIFAPGAVENILPQWFGAKADGVTDDAAAIQAAFDSVATSSAQAMGWRVHFVNGTYYVASSVNLPGPVDKWCPVYITGDGATLYTDQPISILKRWPAAGVAPNLLAYRGFIVDGLIFRGTSLRQQVGLDLGCTYGTRVSNCRFNYLGRGMRLSYAMVAEVINCLTLECAIAGFSATEGYGLWSDVHTWNTNRTTYRSCRAFTPNAVNVAIAGLTRANPCVVTWTNHGLGTGDIVFIDGITQADWTALNKRRFQITKLTDNTFSLQLLDRTDTPANLNTSGYAADYVPATDPGVIQAAVFGWEEIHTFGDTLENCVAEGGRPTDNFFFYQKVVAGLTLIGCNNENSPYGASFYLNYPGGKITLTRFGVNGDVAIDAYEVAAATSAVIELHDYAPPNSSTKIRLPQDSGGANLRWAFTDGGNAGYGFDFSSPDFWYGGIIPERVSNYRSDGYPSIDGSQILLRGGQGIFAKQQPFYGSIYYTGANYKGLRSETNTLGGGGVGAYDITNGQAIMVKQKSSEVTITASGVAIQDVSSFIPAGVMVVGFTARVTQAIGGAATLSVGETGSANLWLNAMGVALNSTGNLTSTTATAPKIYAAVTTVRLTANGGNFNGTGKVRLTVHYISLEAPGS